MKTNIEIEAKEKARKTEAVMNAVRMRTLVITLLNLLLIVFKR